MTISPQEQHANLIQLIRSLIQHDNDLREKYQVGNRFVFVRTGLQNLLSKLEANTMVAIQQPTHETVELSNLITVYVYLYNAQGLQVRTWSALLTPKALYEHSVNRPVFYDKQSIENALRTKSNAAQHAYLAVQIEENQIIPPLPAESGIPAIKVREGSFRQERILAFFHNGQEYVLDEHGELVKK